MAPVSDEHKYSARDVKDVAGLSARQQNDWDERGALPHERESEEGWRRFAVRDIFVIMVSAEMRRQYNIPVERLKWMQEVMLQDGANHFEVAVRMMATLGVGVWVCTDFEEVFIMDTELEFQDLWRSGFFGAEMENGLVFLPLNGLVNQLLSCRKEPIELEAHGLGHSILREASKVGRARSSAEMKVLELIRTDEVKNVEVTSVEGEVTLIRTSRRHDPASDIEALLKEDPFQKISVHMKDGVVVSLEQEIVSKTQKGRS